MPRPIQHLSYIALQPSTSSVISDVCDPSSEISVEDVWISAYRQALQSRHGKLRVREPEVEGDTIEIELRDVRRNEMEFAIVNESRFEFSCPALSIPTTTLLLPNPRSNVPRPLSTSPYASTSQETSSPAFYNPSSTTSSNRTVGIECIALSSDRKRMVVGGKDGSVKVVGIVRFEREERTREGKVERKTRLEKGNEVALRGHVGDLTSVEFFPSNEVVLTASSDMSLRIFSALDGSNPRTLLGHTKRITSTHILTSPSTTSSQQPLKHKGREILSSSLDGTIRMWDVASGKETRAWNVGKEISKMFVFYHQREEEGDDGNEDEDDEEDDVLKGRWAVCGHLDGTVSIVSLFDTATSTSSSVVPRLKLKTSTTSSIESIDYIVPRHHREGGGEGEGLIAVGNRQGIVSIFKLPSTLLTKSSNPTSEHQEEEGEGMGPIVEFERTEGCTINDLKWSDLAKTSEKKKKECLSLLVASSDGLPFRVQIDFNDDDDDDEPTLRDQDREPSTSSIRLRVLEEFVGLDCDPSTSIFEEPFEGEEGGGSRVWISGGGNDGSVRVYELN